MKKYYSITIPKPCHENWKDMTPKEKGRFCDSCSKTVIDFTKMDPYEIQDFINDNRNNRICGHFKQSQLESINLIIPSKVLEQQLSFHKIFLLALFITMGVSLMNCTNKSGNQQKIDSIELLNNQNEEIIDVTLGLQLLNKNKIDSISDKTCKSNSEKIAIIDSTIDGQLGFTTVGDIDIVENPTIEEDSLNIIMPPHCPFPKKEKETEEEIVLGMIEIETPPEFKDTPSHLSVQEKRNYFSKRISKIVSENFNTSVCIDLKGMQKIDTQFKIDKNGNIVDIKVRAAHVKLEEEAQRVIQLLPQFIPATQRDKPVAVIKSLPIIFQVEE